MVGKTTLAFLFCWRCCMLWDMGRD